MELIDLGTLRAHQYGLTADLKIMRRVDPAELVGIPEIDPSDNPWEELALTVVPEVVYNVAIYSHPSPANPATITLAPYVSRLYRAHLADCEPDLMGDYYGVTVATHFRENELRRICFELGWTEDEWGDCIRARCDGHRAYYLGLV